MYAYKSTHIDNVAEECVAQAAIVAVAIATASVWEYAKASEIMWDKRDTGGGKLNPSQQQQQQHCRVCVQQQKRRQQQQQQQQHKCRVQHAVYMCGRNAAGERIHRKNYIYTWANDSGGSGNNGGGGSAVAAHRRTGNDNRVKYVYIMCGLWWDVMPMICSGLPPTRTGFSLP